MKLQHDIPLGTLVEVDLDYSDSHGVRAFIVDHTRDCDGEPMYALSMSSDFEQMQELKKENFQLFRFMINDGWTKDCLKIIREAK